MSVDLSTLCEAIADIYSLADEHSLQSFAVEKLCVFIWLGFDKLLLKALKIILDHSCQHDQVCEALEIGPTFLEEDICRGIQLPVITVIMPAKNHIDLFTVVFGCHILILQQSHMVQCNYEIASLIFEFFAVSLQ